MNNDMNKKNLSGMIFGAALLLFAACTQDDPLGDNGTTLPEGVYPLEISSVTLDAEVSSQPWGADAPQTRVSENPDRNSSKWDRGEVITVQLGDNQTTTYKVVDAGGTLELTGDQLYWTKRADKVTAWYPENGEIRLDNQQGGNLAYVLRATAEEAPYDKSVSLKFTHQLAKIRVKLAGEKAGSVTDVKIESCTSCTNTNGTVSFDNTSVGEITMYRVNNNNTYEANVVPEKAIERFKVNGGDWVDLSTPVTPVAGNYHEITINAESKDFTVTGNYTIEGTHKPIIITGNYTVTFKNARITSDDRPIIKINDGCHPTLVFEGTNVLKRNGGDLYEGGITSGENDEYNIQLEDGAKLAVISDCMAIGSHYGQLNLNISGNGEMWVQSNVHNTPAIIVSNGNLNISEGVVLTAVVSNDFWYNTGWSCVPAIGLSTSRTGISGGAIALSNCTLKLFAWGRPDTPLEHWVTLENGTVTPDVDSVLKEAAWDTEVQLGNSVTVMKLKERPTPPEWAQ